MTAEPVSIDITDADATLALYYDRLSRVVRWARFFGYGGGYAGLAMHRGLAAPGGAAPPSPDALDALLLERLAPARDPDVLDAGCGFGGTVFRWRTRLGGRYDGLTLSAVQAKSPPRMRRVTVSSTIAAFLFAATIGRRRAATIWSWP